jgi:hypothetical protein
MQGEGRVMEENGRIVGKPPPASRVHDIARA